MYLASEYSPITKNGGMARIIIIIARMMMINMTIEAMMSHITKVCYQTLVGNIRIEGVGITQKRDGDGVLYIKRARSQLD